MKIMYKIPPILIPAGLFVWLFLMPSSQDACAIGFNDAAAIGAAYMTHLSLHEIGHQVVAEEVEADFIRDCPPIKTSLRNRNWPMQRAGNAWQALHLNMPWNLTVVNQQHLTRPSGLDLISHALRFAPPRLAL